MVRAIIFDCFGVLATDDWLPFKHRYFGNDPEKFQKASDVNLQANAGLISYEQFVAEIARLANVDAAEVRQALRTNQPNRQLFELMEGLGDRFIFGMLSNSASNWLTDIFNEKQLQLFKQTVLSYQVGMAKPDPRIFVMTADKLGVEPAECLFVDDQERYCTAAAGTGMQAIVYHDFHQFKLDLQPYLD